MSKILLKLKMSKFLIISFVLNLFFNSLQSQDCGVERWSIKTLSDSDTIKINFSKIVPSTIHAQVSLTRPSINRNKRHDTETSVLKIDCSIVGFKRERR